MESRTPMSLGFRKLYFARAQWRPGLTSNLSPLPLFQEYLNREKEGLAISVFSISLKEENVLQNENKQNKGLKEKQVSG